MFQNFPEYSKFFKNDLQSWFKNLWYQKFLPYDFSPEINNLKCFKVYEGHSRCFRSLFGWFLAVSVKPIPKMVVFQKNEKVHIFNFLLWNGLNGLAWASLCINSAFRCLRTTIFWSAVYFIARSRYFKQWQSNWVYVSKNAIFGQNP